VTPPAAPKSISREETFDRDVADADQLRERARHLAADVARRLRAAGLCARTVSLKLRSSDFTTVTRQCALEGGNDSDAAITAAALALLAATHRQGQAVRLLGVGVHGLEAAAQLDLFSASDAARERRLDTTLDSLRRRFGPGAVRRGLPAPDLRDLDWRREDLRQP